VSIEWVNRAVEDMRAWGRARGVVADIDEMRLLCDYASDYLEVRKLGDFTPGTFERLLLDIYPRKVITPPESAAETVAAARALVAFLQDAGEIGGATAARMRERLDEIEPEMPVALADITLYGMAKSIFSAINAESLDLAGPPAAQGPEDDPDSDLDPDPDLDPADGDAAALINSLMSGPPSDFAEGDIARWLAARTARQAATELLAAVAGAPAVVRGIAVTIVDRLGPGAEDVLRGCLDDPELRPHAIHWLSSRGLGAPALTPGEVLWMSVDMLALALPAAAADPESFAENMAASGPPAPVIEELWQVDHPDLVEVLEMLGRTLPDGAAAKAARKAAFKARSRAIG
jgi:hypothetical protein